MPSVLTRLLHFKLKINPFRQPVYSHLLDKETEAGPGGKETCPRSHSVSVEQIGLDLSTLGTTSRALHLPMNGVWEAVGGAEQGNGSVTKDLHLTYY